MLSTVAQRATDVRLRDHLNDLVGLGPKGLTQLESDYPYADLRDGELTMDGALRERADGQLMLEPRVRKHISNAYVDRFLEDCLTVLSIDGDRAGYYHPDFNLRARVHGGACGIESVKPSWHYPRSLLDAMADLRGYNLVTNIGQSGCNSCGGAAIQRLTDELEDHGTSVLGHVGFSAQTNPENPYLNYGSFDSEAISTEDLGYLVLSTLEKHDIPYEWEEDESKAIEAFPAGFRL